MEFFKEVAAVLQDGQQITLTIRKNGENLAMSLLSDTKGVKDKAVDNIVPIVANGTPEEFEEGFIQALQSVGKAQGLVTNIKEFEESVETARKASEMAKKEKDAKAKNKKQFDELIALARKNKDEHKFKDAKAILQKAAAVPDTDKKLIDTVEKEILQVSGEGSMFGPEPDKSDGKDVTEDATAAAFANAMELSDDDENDDDNDNDNEEEE